MTAVLAVVARAVLGAVLLAVVLAAAVCTAFISGAVWKLAWLPVMCAVVWGAVEAWERLGRQHGGSTR